MAVGRYLGDKIKHFPKKYVTIVYHDFAQFDAGKSLTPSLRSVDKTFGRQIFVVNIVFSTNRCQPADASAATIISFSATACDRVAKVKTAHGYHMVYWFATASQVSNVATVSQTSMVSMLQFP